MGERAEKEGMKEVRVNMVIFEDWDEGSREIHLKKWIGFRLGKSLKARKVFQGQNNDVS